MQMMSLVYLLPVLFLLTLSAFLHRREAKRSEAGERFDFENLVEFAIYFAFFPMA